MSHSSDTTIRVTTDEKTHFPLVTIKDVGCLTLWPITKIQFEMYISQVNKYGDKWYEEILKCNPRVSYQQVTKKNYEQLFISGLHFKETLEFSKWFGEDFRLPSVNEYEKIYNIVANQKYFMKAPTDMSYPAKKIWEKLMKFSNSLSKFALMDDGLFEWVGHGEKFVGKGAPRPQLYPNTFTPTRDTVEPLNYEKRQDLFGFRLIKGGDDE